jgi:hypothetical protein
VCVFPLISATVDHCCAFSTIGNRAVLIQIHIRPPLLTLIPWSSTQGTECFWAHLEQSNCRTALRASRTCRAPHTGPLPPVLQAFHMSNCSAGQLATLVASNTLRAKEARLLSNVCNSWGSFGCRRWEYQPQAMLLLSCLGFDLTGPTKPTNN